MTFAVEIVVDVIQDVVECNSVATMIDVPLDLLPEAFDAVGVNLPAARMDEGLRVIDGEMTEEARMELVASPLVGNDR